MPPFWLCWITNYIFYLLIISHLSFTKNMYLSAFCIIFINSKKYITKPLSSAKSHWFWQVNSSENCFEFRNGKPYNSWDAEIFLSNWLASYDNITVRIVLFGLKIYIYGYCISILAIPYNIFLFYDIHHSFYSTYLRENTSKQVQTQYY